MAVCEQPPLREGLALPAPLCTHAPRLFSRSRAPCSRAHGPPVCCVSASQVDLLAHVRRMGAGSPRDDAAGGAAGGDGAAASPIPPALFAINKSDLAAASALSVHAAYAGDKRLCNYSAPGTLTIGRWVLRWVGSA